MDRKQVVKGILIALLLVAIAAAAFGAIYYFDHQTKEEADDDIGAPDPTFLYLCDLEYELTDNVKTYMIVGTDGAGSKPNAKRYHGPMSDYMLLLVINKTKGTHGFIEVDRDTITDIVQIGPDGDDETADIVEEQICTATWWGKDIEQGLTKATCDDLEKHAYSVNDSIADSNIRNRHILAGV